jgi:hypothetical protein
MLNSNNYIKTDAEGYVKDASSGAILSVDNTKLNAYKKQKQFINNSIKNNERIERVERDLSDIKQMLQLLLRENNKC